MHCKKRARPGFFAIVIAVALLANLPRITGCAEKEYLPEETLHIAAGSESKEIEPIIKQFAQDEGFGVQMHYIGSVDMMLDLSAQYFVHDAVLPANSMWIRLGDSELHRVSDEASIMRSPVVLGVKKSKAQELGWIDAEVSVDDILQAVRSRKLRFAMTSATQSNSGASAYMGMLHALSGQPAVLDATHLEQPDVRERIEALLAGVDRSSGSSGWLKDMFLKKYDSLDAMFNYEAMVIAANRELAAQNREPLYAIYPSDGLAIADSTLGFVKKSDNSHKKEYFIKLRDHLLRKETQQEIFKTGFRTALIGMNPGDIDKDVYNPAWGIDLERTISPIPWPKAEVIRQALFLYQTTFRKPSFTVYLLDVSGSMQGEGLAELKRAMGGLLDQQQAGEYLLQVSDQDRMAVIPFNSRVGQPVAIEGNDPARLQELLDYVYRMQAGGGTNIYAPVASALQFFQANSDTLENYLPAIVLMTDGKSNAGSLQQVQSAWANMNAGFDLPPIFGVTFGKADDTQLQELARFSVGRVFDGRKGGLVKAFRKAKGYN